MQTKNNMAFGAKTQRNIKKNKKKSIIPQKNKDKILHAYIALYNAFLLQNLLAGKTLGLASYAALQMLKTKIATMDKRNPVTKLLRHIHAYHVKVISKRIMTSRFRDSRATIKPENRAKLTARVSELFNSANVVLNTMSAQYKPKPKPKQIAKKQQFVMAQIKVMPKQAQTKQQTNDKQKLLLQIYMRQQMQKQRAA